MSRRMLFFKECIPYCLETNYYVMPTELEYYSTQTVIETHDSVLLF